jgi:hypothetical protein
MLWNFAWHVFHVGACMPTTCWTPSVSLSLSSTCEKSYPLAQTAQFARHTTCKAKISHKANYWEFVWELVMLRARITCCPKVWRRTSWEGSRICGACRTRGTRLFPDAHTRTWVRGQTHSLWCHIAQDIGRRRHAWSRWEVEPQKTDHWELVQKITT